MKKIISLIIILALIMSLSMSVVATASTLIAPTEEVTLTESGPSGNPNSFTINGNTATRQTRDAEINRIFQGATTRLISFDAVRRSNTTESSGSATRSAAITRLNNEQAPWGAAYRTILSGADIIECFVGGNSVAIHDLTGNGIPELIFAAGSGRIDFFVYSFDGSRANRIVFIEGLQVHVSNTTFDAYVTSGGALIVRGGNGGDDGHEMFFGETYHIFRNIGAQPTTPTAPIPPTTPTAPISVYIDGTRLTFDVPPMLVDGRVLVPMRAIFEALGAEVNWNDATRTATGTRGGTTVVLPLVGTPTVSGQAVTIDVPPHVVDGRILVPLRFVSQSFGAEVNWDGNARTVTITSGSASGAVTLPAPPQQATGLAVNPEIFDIMGMTFNEIVSRHGPVVSENWFQGSRYYVHERGLGTYFYYYNGRFYPETDRDREHFRLNTIITSVQELFLSSSETLNRNDFEEAFGVTMSEIWENNMDGGYAFDFTYRNASVSVNSERDGTVRSGSQVWISLLRNP